MLDEGKGSSAESSQMSGWVETQTVKDVAKAATGGVVAGYLGVLGAFGLMQGYKCSSSSAEVFNRIYYNGEPDTEITLPDKSTEDLDKDSVDYTKMDIDMLNPLPQQVTQCCTALGGIGLAAWINYHMIVYSCNFSLLANLGMISGTCLFTKIDEVNKEFLKKTEGNTGLTKEDLQAEYWSVLKEVFGKIDFTSSAQGVWGRILRKAQQLFGACYEGIKAPVTTLQGVAQTAQSASHIEGISTGDKWADWKSLFLATTTATAFGECRSGIEAIRTEIEFFAMIAALPSLYSHMVSTKSVEEFNAKRIALLDKLCNQGGIDMKAAVEEINDKMKMFTVKGGVPSFMHEGNEWYTTVDASGQPHTSSFDLSSFHKQLERKIPLTEGTRSQIIEELQKVASSGRYGSFSLKAVDGCSNKFKLKDSNNKEGWLYVDDVGGLHVESAGGQKAFKSAVDEKFNGFEMESINVTGLTPEMLVSTILYDKSKLNEKYIMQWRNFIGYDGADDTVVSLIDGSAPQLSTSPSRLSILSPFGQGDARTLSLKPKETKGLSWLESMYNKLSSPSSFFRG